MKLISCHIQGFGKIKNQSFSFTDGLNKIVGENGSGKTTLSVFIKVMLYGMSDSRKSDLEENDRKHYLPWDGGTAGGSLVFSVGDKQYRVERSFSQKAAEDNFALYDTSTGKLSSDFSENLGKELFGIDADGFERTVFLSERNLTEAGKNQTVSAKLGGLVGCDGDIEGMDGALKALEEERKRYFKKGGYGEIAETKKQIFEIDNQLDELTAIETKLATDKERLKESQSFIQRINEELGKLEIIREQLIRQKAEEVSEKRILAIKNKLGETEAAILSLEKFFSPGIPSHDEINELSFKYIEAKRLTEKRDDNPEYERLKRRFSMVGDNDVAEAADAISAIDKNRAKAHNADSVRFAETFKNRIPEKKEVDELLSEYEGKEKRKASLFYQVGGAIIVIGLLLGILVSPILFLICTLGGVIISVPVTDGLKKSKKEKNLYEKAVEFFESLGTQIFPKTDIKNSLLHISELLLRTEELYVRNESDFMQPIYNLVGKLYEKTESDAISEARLAINQYKEYTSLSTFMKYKSSESDSMRIKGEKMMEEVNAFVESYSLTGERPFETIRAALNEYQRLVGERNMHKAELSMLESKNKNISSKAISLSEEELNEKKSFYLEQLNEKRREVATVERNITSLSLSLDERDDLLAERDELTERLKAYEEKYRIIQLTKELLSQAKDSMTSKYLGKTKAGFLEYIKLISEDEGEFEMNTAFSVSRLEGGRAKPSEGYSKGTRDLFAIASRFALIDSLYDGETPPIILDDPFISFDDKRAEAAMELLYRLGAKKQIIYFTCSSSRG